MAVGAEKLGTYNTNHVATGGHWVLEDSKEHGFKKCEGNLTLVNDFDL